MQSSGRTNVFEIDLDVETSTNKVGREVNNSKKYPYFYAFL